MSSFNTMVAAVDSSEGQHNPFELELAKLIIEALMLEVQPHDIMPCEPLFYEGLGLDSIDALEIALAISRRYGLDLKSDDARKEQIFASLRSLAAYVQAHRPR